MSLRTLKKLRWLIGSHSWLLIDLRVVKNWIHLQTLSVVGLALQKTIFLENSTHQILIGGFFVLKKLIVLRVVKNLTALSEWFFKVLVLIEIQRWVQVD
jgi:hypothetical protein